MNYFLERYLWFKNFYHIIFAHKPLCDRFRSNIIRLKGIYICRGCLFLWFGLFAFSVLNYFCMKDLMIRSFEIVLFAIAAYYSHPLIYIKIKRWQQDCIRAFLGGIISYVMLLLYESDYILAAIIIVCMIVLRLHYALLRKVLQDSSCNDCFEFNRDKICSGFVKKAEAMKNYEKAITEHIYGNS